jgi:hypothetical protein
MPAFSVKTTNGFVMVGCAAILAALQKWKATKGIYRCKPDSISNYTFSKPHMSLAESVAANWL